MKTHVFQPASVLRPFINRHIILNGEEDANASFLFQIPPTGYSGLAFHLTNNRINVDGVKMPPSFLIGQYTQRMRVQFKEKIELLISFFHPSQLFRFFLFPMYKLTNLTISLSEVIGDQMADKLVKKIRKPNEYSNKIEQLENYLLIEQKKAKTKWNPADKAISDIVKSKGKYSVEDLAKLNNVTRRYLEKNFRERIGLSPKLYSKIIRFNYLLELLGKSSKPTWLDLLEECGFYDQAHLIKDFHEFTGEIPSRFFKQNIIDMKILERFEI